MEKAKETQFVVTEVFRSEEEADRREALRQIIDDYLRAKLET